LKTEKNSVCKVTKKKRFVFISYREREGKSGQQKEQKERGKQTNFFFGKDGGREEGRRERETFKNYRMYAGSDKDGDWSRERE
jgi:hypothetical protein